MQHNHQPARPTVYEVCRRYIACLYALSDILGIPPEDMLTRHRKVISACFMQASREGVRLANSVPIPPLIRLIDPHRWKESKVS